MTVVVAFKWAPDPQDGRVSDSGEVDWSGVSTSAVGDDGVAVEVARALAEALGEESVGITLGGKNADWALARGVDRVLAADAELAGASDTRRAAALAALVRRIDGVRAVIIGDSAVDSGAAVVPAMLAGLLGWDGVLGATQVSVDGATVLVQRRTQTELHTISATGPALIAVTTDAATPRVPGMKDVLMARKRPVETVPLAGLGIDDTAELTLLASRRMPGGRKATLFDGSDAPRAVEQLVDALRSAQAL